MLNDKTKNVIDDLSALKNGNFAIVVGGRVSAETLFVLKKYAEENNVEIFTTAKETDANYYAVSKLEINKYENLAEDVKSVLLVNTDIDTDKNKVSVELSPYCEKGTFFDKYGNKKTQNVVFQKETFAQIINNKLANPFTDLTVEIEKAITSIPTGKVTIEDIINASKLF